MHRFMERSVSSCVIAGSHAVGGRERLSTPQYVQEVERACRTCLEIVFRIPN
jgi:hypothetical protein